MSSAGQGSMSFSQKNEPAPAPGPPFLATSADNGLSVDAITGKIVFGDNTGGILGQLLNNREIQMNTRSLSLLNGQLLNINSLNPFIAGFTSSSFQTVLSSMIQINHNGGNNGLVITRATNDNNSANFNFYHTRGGNNAATLGALVDGDGIGFIGSRGVCADGISVQAATQFITRGVTTNPVGTWGVGVPPVNRIGGLFDLITTNLAGVASNRLRIFPNGEFSFVDLPVGAIIPRLNGMMVQVYGTAGIQTSLNVGAIANNNALAVLELTSTTKGFLPARMTAVQGTALAVGAAEDGLQIHVTTVNATFSAVGPYWWNNALGLWVAM